MTIAQTTLTVVDSAFRNNEAGTAAGAIQNGGIASITNTELSENATVVFGGAIVNHGQLTLIDSDLVGNDSSQLRRRIFTMGDATLKRCLVEDNSSGSGGGIVNSATLAIESSTLDGNRATAPAGAGGAIGIDAGSGAITTTVRDSTLQQQRGGEWRGHLQYRDAEGDEQHVEQQRSHRAWRRSPEPRWDQLDCRGDLFR